jgi:hypothetical protein
MNRRLPAAALLAFCFFSLQPPFVHVARAQWASNASGDLFGENRGDFILFQFLPTDSAALYLMYVGYSSNGPWSVFGADDTAAGGARMHITPEARTTDLCYKVEAKDLTGTVIKTYEPICVPKYAVQQ